MRTLGIVGGGRWARIIDRVAGANGYATQFYTRNNKMGSVNSLMDLDSNHTWVANLPDDHYYTAKELIAQGRHVLVEKPFVRTVEQHDELVELAQAQGVKLIVGLEMTYSSCIAQIAETVTAQPKAIDIVWSSANRVQRHGEMYYSDPTISVLEDIGPHVLSILDTILVSKKCQVLKTTQTDTGILWLLDIDGTVVNVEFARDSNNTRTIVIDGEFHDFSKDDGLTLDRQLDNFVNGERQYNTAENTRWITEAIEHSTQQLMPQHLEIVRHNTQADRAGIVGLYVAKDILEMDGYARSRYDERLYTILDQIVQVIDCYAHSPFVTQSEIQRKLNISKQQLIKINKIMRNSDFVQQVITGDIRNSQYWKNTIIPLNQTGTIQKVLNNEYAYPHRIGLHIGQSCMFWCHFCGRNMETNAAYKKTPLKEATPHLVNLIKTAPNDDPYKFYLSGGLETLTNPDLMQLIRAGADRGFRFSLYTNGFMLTEKYLDLNPDIWDLEVLRISLYGSNQDVYTEVTKHKQGFTRVKQNAIDFLKYRKQHNKQLRFGFNYVILPGLEEDFLQVLDFIEEINAASDSQVDFITLRENFREPTDTATFGDRTKLKQVFEIVERRRTGALLNKLHIDYGYALNALSQGVDAPTMHCITYDQMLPKGFPQVDLVVDAYGLVYLCREAGFLDRTNNDRYIIGKVDQHTTLEQVVQTWITQGKPIELQKGDTEFMDSYEHIISLIINQSIADAEHGVPESQGPIRAKSNTVDTVSVQAFYQGDTSARVN